MTNTLANTNSVAITAKLDEYVPTELAKLQESVLQTLHVSLDHVWFTN